MAEHGLPSVPPTMPLYRSGVDSEHKFTIQDNGIDDMKKSARERQLKNRALIHNAFPAQGSETAPPQSMSNAPGKEPGGINRGMQSQEAIDQQGSNPTVTNPGSYSGYSGGNYSSAQEPY